MDVPADVSLYWSHRTYCRFCRVLAHMDLFKRKKKVWVYVKCAEFDHAARMRAFRSAFSHFTEQSITIKEPI